VPLSNAKSNLAMLQCKLQQHKAKAAKLIGFCPCLENSQVEREQFLAEFNTTNYPKHNSNNRERLTIDICVLGMGEDGHIASLFPDMPGLSAALDTSLSPELISANPANKEARVSLNLSALLSAHYHYLLITGKTKQQIIQEEQATQIEQYPIGHLIAQTSLMIYYSD
jgi:6-phosphogluconolactonase/glucosamine-6-phosphate isomerase/deaminase